MARFCCPLKAAEGDIRRITLYRQHGGAQRVCVEASLAVCGSWAGSSSRYSVGSESQLLPCKAGRLSQLRGQAMRLRPTLLHPCCWSSVWFPWVSALMPWWWWSPCCDGGAQTAGSARQGFLVSAGGAHNLPVLWVWENALGCFPRVFIAVDLLCSANLSPSISLLQCSAEGEGTKGLSIVYRQQQKCYWQKEYSTRADHPVSNQYR